MNLWSELESAFKSNALRPSVSDEEGNSLSYEELLHIVQGLAMHLRAQVQRKSRICVLNSHSYYDAIGILGVLAADCVGVPMSLNYGESNCCRIMQRAEPSILLTNINPLPDSMQEVIREKKILVLPVETGGEYPFVEPASQMSDLALLMFTSGTTGTPKGAMLSHSNLLCNLKDIAAYFTLAPDDHFLIARPLYHAAVMTGEFLHALMHGSRITFYNEAFSPKRLLTFLEASRCSVMCATPTLFYHLAINKRKTELPSLRKITVSGECLLPQVAEKLISAFSSVEFLNVYGLTEASPRVSHLDPEFFIKKVGSVGIPLNSVKVKIVNEEGTEMLNGEIGELLVRGPNVMMGYWKDEDLSAKKIVNGWLHTGDLARLDEGGFIYIIGRKDYMIIRAGVNIYPQEIENSLLKNDSIKEIMIWGEPDPISGQRICAALVPHEGVKLTVKEFMLICRNCLEPYKWPDEVMIMDALPRNASGKLMRGRPKTASV
jgi:long-chain acyl-CoA synthetase